jgi:GDP-L-fucose synthase
VSSNGGFYRGKTVLVTGGTGFIGRHLVADLLAQSAHVVVPVHRRPLPPELSGVEATTADLTLPEDCLRVTRGADCVFHAAGAVAGAGAPLDAEMSGVVTNLVLTARVLEAAWKNRVGRCLVFSSSTVYPAVARPVREGDMWSGPPDDSYFAYGWMRRYVEKLSEFVSRKSSVQMAIVRPTAVYGRYDNFAPATSHFVPALVRRAVERADPFEVWGTGDETRDLLHVTDLARGCLLALEKHACGEAINIGFGTPVSVGDVVRTVLDAADYSGANVTFNPGRPGTIRSRIVDCTKARQVLGFHPSVSLEDGIRDTVRWYREDGAGGSRTARTVPAPIQAVSHGH